MPPIQQDGALDYANALETEDEIANAFLADPQETDEDAPTEPSDKNGENQEQDDDNEANDEEPSDESPEGDAEGDESEDQEDETKDEKKYADGDDIYVKVKVGEEEHEVPVKDLKRLFGQEAALTRKSQEVADERKTVDADRAKNIAAYDVMLKRSTERADQYRALPWTQLMKDPNVPADQLQALQAEAAKAYDDETFIKSELDGFMAKVSEAQKGERVKAAQECLKTITNPESPLHIKGWNEAVYNDLRTFGVKMGLDKELVNNLTDAGAFKVLHMALQFERGASKVVTTKVNKTAKKIVKNSASAPAARSNANAVTRKTAVDKLKRSGSMEDAAAAFLVGFGDD